MDDDVRQLEAELRRLQPVAPSRRLFERIASDLDASSIHRHRRKIIWLWAGALSAAAAVGLLLPQFGLVTTSKFSTTQPETSARDATFKPVAAENLLISANDEGLVMLADGTPARRERLHYVDTITWQNSRTNASLRWSVPREEIRVIPISLQ